jgi:hypothetical protein
MSLVQRRLEHLGVVVPADVCDGALGKEFPGIVVGDACWPFVVFLRRFCAHFAGDLRSPVDEGMGRYDDGSRTAYSSSWRRRLVTGGLQRSAREQLAVTWWTDPIGTFLG